MVPDSNGTGPNNGTAGGAAATQNDLSNATNRSATGELTENPACINNISGWYTRTGNTETDAFTGIRKVVIKWDGATIGTFNDNELTSIGTIKRYCLWRLLLCSRIKSRRQCLWVVY